MLGYPVFFKQKYVHRTMRGCRIPITREMVVKKVAEVVQDFIDQVLIHAFQAICSYADSDFVLMIALTDVGCDHYLQPWPASPFRTRLCAARGSVSPGAPSGWFYCRDHPGPRTVITIILTHIILPMFYC